MFVAALKPSRVLRGLALHDGAALRGATGGGLRVDSCYG